MASAIALRLVRRTLRRRSAGTSPSATATASSTWRPVWLSPARRAVKVSARAPGTPDGDAACTAISSSTYNGIPSPRVMICSSRALPGGSVRFAASSRIASSASGPSDSSSPSATSLASRLAPSGRVVATSISRPEPTVEARKVTRSSDVASDQCRSSRTRHTSCSSREFEDEMLDRLEHAVTVCVIRTGVGERGVQGAEDRGP